MAVPLQTRRFPHEFTAWPWDTYGVIDEVRWRRHIPNVDAVPIDMAAWDWIANAWGWGLRIHTAGNLSTGGSPGIELLAGSPNEVVIQGDDADVPGMLSVNGGFGALYLRVAELRLGFADGSGFRSAVPRPLKNATGSARTRGDVVRLARSHQLPGGGYDNSLDNSVVALEGGGNDRRPLVVAHPRNGYGNALDPTTLWVYRPGDKVQVRCSEGEVIAEENLVADAGYAAKMDTDEADPKRLLAVATEYKPPGAPGLVWALIL